MIVNDFNLFDVLRASTTRTRAARIQFLVTGSARPIKPAEVLAIDGKPTSSHAAAEPLHPRLGA